jgi:hypothetical protein
MKNTPVQVDGFACPQNPVENAGMKVALFSVRCQSEKGMNPVVQQVPSFQQKPVALLTTSVKIFSYRTAAFLWEAKRCARIFSRNKATCKGGTP